MQELVQITKEEPLTFEDICPDFNMLIREHGWYGVKGTRFTVDNKERNIARVACCIVGEAHGG